MTTTQKILVTATTAAAIVAVYEAHRASEMETEIWTLREQQASSTGQIERLQRERDEASKRLALLTDENTALKNDSAELAGVRDEMTQLKAAVQVDATQSAAKSWLDRLSRLKQRMEQTPNAKIPELQLLTEEDWLNAARDNLESERDYRRSLSALRNAGIRKFVKKAMLALRRYVAANNRQFPTDVSQLQPYFEPPVDEVILQRYEIIPSDRVPNSTFNEEWIMALKAPVDEEFDQRWAFGSTQSVSWYQTPD